MSLKTRIWLLPATAAAIFLVGGAVVGFVSSGASHAIGTLGDVDYPYLDQMQRLSNDLENVQNAFSVAIQQSEKDMLAQADTVAQDARAALEEMRATRGHGDDARALSGLFEGYYGQALPTARIFLGMDKGDGAAAAGRMQEALKALKEGVAQHQAGAKSAFNESIGHARAGVHNTVWSMVGAGFFVVAALGAGSFLLVGSIWRQIGGEPEYARQVLHAVSQGDLSQSIAVAPRAEHSVLGAVRDMQQGIATLIASVRDGSSVIATASREIATGNQDLSSRTEEQATSLQRTAASMEEIRSTVQQSAEHARQATQLATRASEAADQGGTVVGQVIDTMDGILASSRKIAEIVNVIDGIAFQTNILALNAAVEAARAGEDGRGFAVVAGEVRNLAQRSAQAAREIKNMIDDSVNKVDAGSALVNAAGTSMTEIVAQVKRVNDLIAEMSTAAIEQSQGILQVSEAVTQMDRVTQQNAALVEQSAAAAESLQGESARLASTISVFKIAHGELAAVG